MSLRREVEVAISEETRTRRSQHRDPLGSEVGDSLVIFPFISCLNGVEQVLKAEHFEN